LTQKKCPNRTIFCCIFSYSKHHQDEGITTHEGIKKGISFPFNTHLPKDRRYPQCRYSPGKTQIATLASSLKQLIQKTETLRQLNTEIAEAIQTTEELEAEVLEAEETQEGILDKISQVKHILELRSSTTGHPLDASATVFVPTPQELSHSEIMTSVTEEPVPRREQPVSHLPKLNLPNFGGDPLTWQSFWDSYNAAVNSNTALDGVQNSTIRKCSYREMPPEL